MSSLNKKAAVTLYETTAFLFNLGLVKRL